MNSIDIFPWNENFNTGVSEIDRQHKRLVELLNLLARHMAFQSDIPAINLIFDELADYVDYHFKTEEALLSQYLSGDGLEASHKALHNQFFATVTQLKNGQDHKPKRQVIEEIVIFLTRWLAGHIMNDDRYLALVIKGIRSGYPQATAKHQATQQMSGDAHCWADIITTIYATLSGNTLRLMREMAEHKNAQEALFEERKQAELQMTRSISLLTATLESITDAILVVNSQDHWELYNQQFLDLWNVPEEIARSNDDKAALSYALAQLKDADAFLNKVQELYDSPESSSFDTLIFKNGKIIERYSIPQRIGTQVVGRVWSFRDVTERKRTELFLQRESTKNLALLRNASDGVHILDIQGNILEVSDSFCEMLGYQRSEMIGMNVGQWDAKLSLAQCGQLINDLLANRTRSQFESLHRRKDGSIFDVEVSGFPLPLDGEPMLFFSSRDISERKSAENRLIESESRFRELFENTPLAYQSLDINGHFLDVNRQLCDMLGYSKEELIDKPFDEIWQDEVKPIFPAKFSEFKANNQIGTELTLKAKNGAEVIVLLNGRIQRDIEGKFVRTHCVLANITERKALENDQRIAAIAFESQEGMMVTDASQRILKVNKAFTKITGYGLQDVLGKTPSLLQSGHQDKTFFTKMWHSIQTTGQWEGEIWNRRKNGTVYPEYLTVTAVKNQMGQVTHYVGTFTDITLKKAAADQIERLAFYDHLTSLPNRRLLQERLKAALAASHRHGRKGALLFIDLDHFKNLNDTLGHDIGDLLLQDVAARLTVAVRENDMVARLGGDEFVLMLEDLSGNTSEAATQAEMIGYKIHAAINQPFKLDTHNYLCSPSIGIVLFDGIGQSADELLKQADIAMYQAKKEGRNTLRFFDQHMQDLLTLRTSLEHELREAIIGQQFVLYYQIQMDSANCPVGAEALSRWQHPKHGLLSPANFITLAEETGLILHLGQWVIETACTQLGIWQQHPHTQDWVLSVNVSAKQFFESHFVRQVQTAIAQHDINPARLKLELTESMLLKNIDETIATMNALRETGVQFSLDDFGTGYSSLQYLKKLPLHQLKIDQSFVQDIASDNSDQVIVRTIIAMASSLNLEVIAEGVETEAQREFLLNNGCTNFQGYLFGKPVPIRTLQDIFYPGDAKPN